MDSEIDVIVTICKQLVELQKREDAKPEFDKELGSDATDSLEEAIESLERFVALDDPTPQNLWDHSGGEPPMTLDEMHKQAWNDKMKYKS